MFNHFETKLSKQALLDAAGISPMMMYNVWPIQTSSSFYFKVRSFLYSIDNWLTSDCKLCSKPQIKRNAIAVSVFGCIVYIPPYHPPIPADSSVDDNKNWCWPTGDKRPFGHRCSLTFHCLVISGLCLLHLSWHGLNAAGSYNVFV